ncbi:HYR domain-containing protein [uncultured Draconibacterium sp.]|uniref:HYR domain-containing protein n=1 Tax=uncultured Draconibacterium sp. TaxID=1573823 RepID=UPI0032167F9F
MQKSTLLKLGLFLLLGITTNALRAQIYTFTNCGQTGRTGPTQVQIDAEYAATNLAGLVTINTQGIQEWTVPFTGDYIIEVLGAEGGHRNTSNGGLGAKMEGIFTLTQGEILKILVGQAGEESTAAGVYQGGGGGGGTFVVESDNTPLIIAGGGGGRTSTGVITEIHANSTTDGADTYLDGGGNSGNGGQSGITNGDAGGGGGLLTDGGGNIHDNGGEEGGHAFLNGGLGGLSDGDTYHGGDGGFGGGGGGWNNIYCRSGGGGGYSGGQGGTWSGIYSGGGGGSYNAGTNQSNLAAVNSGDGMVIITFSSVCIEDIVQDNDAGECGAVVTYTQPTAWDTATVRQIDASGLTSGDEFPVGVTTQSYELVWDGGASVPVVVAEKSAVLDIPAFAVDTCTFTVTVNDTLAPEITCPANISVSNDAGLCGAVVNYTVSSTDNCSGGTGQSLEVLYVDNYADNATEVPNELVSDGHNVTSVLNEYSNGYSTLNGDLSAYDLIVWDARWGYNIPLSTLNNIEAWVQAGGNILVTGYDVVFSTQIQSFLGGSSGSDFGGNNDLTVLGPGNNLTTGIYDIVGTTIFAISDWDALNAPYSDETVNIVGAGRWTLRTIVGGGQIAWLTGYYYQDGKWSTPGSGYYEALKNFAFNTSSITQTAGLPSGSEFPVGTTTNTFEVADDSGNKSYCSFTVTVTDTTLPTVACQDTTIYLDENGEVTIDTSFVYIDSDDVCGVASISLDKSQFSGPNLGVNPVVISVVDVNGNVGTCTSSVTVIDTVAPEARCKNIGITLDLEGKARIYTGFIDNGSTDAVGIVSYSLDKTKFYCHDIGENTVVMSVKDASGNVSTCSSVVTIADNWLPEVACNDIEVTLGSEGFVVIDSSMIDAGSTAICGISGIELSQSVFTSADLGENSITMTVSNLSGITATCEAKVTVKDEIAPVANCNSITVWLTDSASYELTEADLVAISSGSSDNASASDSLQVEVSPSVFYCSQVGDSVKVDVSVFDEAGNESTCEAMVYVKDSSDVLLSSVENIEISLPAGECETTITYPEVFSSKACATITQIAGLGAEGLFPAGTTVESWEVSYGEEKDTISFAVIVSAENAVPTIDSLADVSVNEDEGPVVIALSGISAGVDCVEQTLSITAENSNSELVSGIEVVYTDGDTTGSISLTLGANQSGTDSLTIVVEDSEGAQTTVSFALTVNPVNDAPYLVTPLPDAIVNASYSFELELSAMMGVVFDDVDDDVLAFDVMLEGTDSLPSWAAIEAGVLTATPMIADTGSYSFVVTATDTSGAMASDTFVLEVDGYPTAIGDIGAGSFELNLYPNPTKGLVTVELQERSATDIEIKVMNVSGAEVFRKNFGANDKIQFNLSDQVSGMYMVLIEADGQRVVKKLILDKR